MIYEMLSRGSTNAISAAHIAKQLDISPQQVRKMVERERLAGYVILTDECGYYLPSEDPELSVWEIQSWIAHRTATAGTLLKTVEMAKKALPSYEQPRT